MGENDRKEKKDKLFCKRDIVIIVITLLASIVLIFFIAGAVKINEGKEWISLEGWLAYYGSIGGAMFGGYITAIGLYITFRINNKQLEEQRKIDNERWENSNRQFNQQMKIQIINEKINDYKRCIESIDEFINTDKEIHDVLSAYENSLELFFEELEYKCNEAINKGETSNVDVFNFDNIERSFNNSLNKLELICVNMNCIAEEYIKEELTRSLIDYEKITECYIEIRNFNTENEFTNLYEDYFKNNMKLYKSFLEKTCELEEVHHKYFEATLNIKNDFSKLKDYIRHEIAKLYNQKYNLDK